MERYRLSCAWFTEDTIDDFRDQIAEVNLCTISRAVCFQLRGNDQSSGPEKDEIGPACGEFSIIKIFNGVSSVHFW